MNTIPVACLPPCSLPGLPIRARLARVALGVSALIALQGCGNSGSAGTSQGSGAAGTAAKPLVLRVGHFPNVTHAHGLIAHALSRQGKGWFEQRLGPGVTIEWYTYNAGPSAMEAILT